MSSPSASPFEVLRHEIPITRLLQANSHHKASCIAHSDSDPSMHVYEDHVHCYACGFHGDVVDVWRVQRGIDRPIEAALDLAREFGIELPEFSPEAAKKSEERREYEQLTYEAAKKYHTMMEEKKKYARVRTWWEGRGFGPELRERFLLGALGPTEASIP